MNSAWLPCLGALALDGLALWPLWAKHGSPAVLAGSPVLHLFACLLFAVVAPRVLPAGHAHRGQETGRLAFVLALVLPVLGMLGLLVLLASACWCRDLPTVALPWSRLSVQELPAALLTRQSEASGWRSRNILAILRNAPAQQTRLEALRATLKLPDVTAAALLRKALRDSDEEVRLLAYALLSRKEKAIETQIHALQSTLKQQDGAANFSLHKALAYCYWQLALLDPPGRAAATPLMSFASEHASLALDLQPGDTGLSLLQGRILLNSNEWDAAKTVFQSVAVAGLPGRHTQPWLAETLFQQRRSGTGCPSGLPPVAGAPARLAAVQYIRKGDGYATVNV